MTYDIVIVGAGPAGLSFARSLADSGLRIAMVEKQSRDQLANPAFDGRDIALTHLSVRLLRDLGVWDQFAEQDRSAIKAARVLDGTSAYALDFDNIDDSVEALGYIISNHVIRKALYSVVEPLEEVEILTDKAVVSISAGASSSMVTLDDDQQLQCSLVVAADSRFSETRRMMGIPAAMQDFGRVCIVCRMEHKLPHEGIAYECFHYGRTLAVLPLGSKLSSIVVTAPMDQSDSLLRMDDAEFSRDIQTRFDNRYGDMTLATERFAYPLVGVHASRFYGNRFALIGDAAVGMHPVTAHGYNLGLSGQEILANEILAAVSRGTDIAATELLRRYDRRHMRITKPMYYGTNHIVGMFTDDRLPAKLLRTAALRLANNLPPVKHAIRNKLTELTGSKGMLPPIFR